MARWLTFAGLMLGIAAIVAWLLFARADPDAEARRAFRRNLADCSANWSSVELECPSPGCANEVKACWAEAGVSYVFSGFRHPKAMGGGGGVGVYAANSYRDGTGPQLVSYVFMSDGSPTKVLFRQGVEGDIGWAEPRVREFFYAIPTN